MRGLSREPRRRQASVAAFADEFAAAATQPLDVPRAGLLGSIKGLFGSRG